MSIDHYVAYLGSVLELLGYEERARRTLNLVYANLLSQADRPRFRRSPIRGTLNLLGRGPLAFVTAKVYSDEEIEGKFLTFPLDLKIAELFLPPKTVFDVFDNELHLASGTRARPGAAASLPRTRPISRHAGRAGEERLPEVDSLQTRMARESRSTTAVKTPLATEPCCGASGRTESIKRGKSTFGKLPTEGAIGFLKIDAPQ